MNDPADLAARLRASEEENEALRRELASTRELLDCIEHSLDGIWDWEVQSERDYLSPRWKLMLGYEPDELPNTVDTWKSLLLPGEFDRAGAALDEHFNRGGAYDLVLRYRKKNGDVAHMLARGKAVRDEHGAWVRMAGTHTDVSELVATREALERANEELDERVAARTTELAEAHDRLREALSAETHHRRALEQSNRELEDFARVASHDLQEPLRKIAMTIDLLATDYGPQLDDEARRMMGYAVDAATRMRQLVRDLLAYSSVRLEVPTAQAVTVQLVVDEVLEDLGKPISDVGASVAVGDLFDLHIEAHHLRQLLQNLIGNALKYAASDDTRIEITGTAQGEFVSVAVHDNGPGVPPRHRDRVFGVFTRLHGTTHPGTGIGLALCRRIAEIYGGTISVTDSDRLGGACFSFEIPIQRSGSNTTDQ